METAGRKVGKAFQTKERGIGAMLPDDEVITKVSKAGIPAGTFGVVESIDEDRIWVDVFIPADADIPEDTVCYSVEELEIQ